NVEFTHDWLLDDLPCWMTTEEGPLLCLPYTWEINDVPMWAVQGQSSDELTKRLTATLAVLERECERNPRVLSIGLHPPIAAVRPRCPPPALVAAEGSRYVHEPCRHRLCHLE